MIAQQSAPPLLRKLLWAGVAIGTVILAAAVAGYASERFWLSYLINFCFWSGLAQAGVVFSAAYRLTNGTWGETIRRVAEGFVLFIPVSAVLFLLIYAGRSYLWPWIEEPIEAKGAWLNEPFFFLRVTFYFVALSILSIVYVRTSIRPELGRLRELGQLPQSRLADFVLRGWQGFPAESGRRAKNLPRLVPAMLISYGFIYSFVGFDVVMSLDPHWYSTMYGWLYFVHAFDAGVAATIIVAILSRKLFTLEQHVSPKQFYDVSRLLMGLCMLAGGFYWSQFLVIWYGNLGEEIGRLVVRFDHAPWYFFQWTVIGLLYFFPIIVFLSKSIKEKPRALLVIASLILSANWLYQFVEIAPSVWKGDGIPLGPIELLTTIGFLSAVGLCWLAYAKVVPLVSTDSTKTV
ncbi:MAG: hypothetical protein A3H45_05325 [Ignavibacteria bacterium RIFCSPLOWO2_02_FULL_55_14]|nr:MAG: hypothetical protein A3C56_08270 [Ignavibacteria bacterium RIFCSPHIGHO2_02_FULL_56_12]OGU69148.1 MAG: hypothetical protein A3H45_05325 [Ignavibacteria bacterium RIFCSPLOWO2_02_FULL_55_14]